MAHQPHELNKYYLKYIDICRVYNHLGEFTRMWGFYLEGSDCEELVGVTHRR